MNSVLLRRLVPSVKKPWTRIDRGGSIPDGQTVTVASPLVQKFLEAGRRRPIGHGLSYIELAYRPATSLDRQRK